MAFPNLAAFTKGKGKKAPPSKSPASASSASPASASGASTSGSASSASSASPASQSMSVEAQATPPGKGAVPSKSAPSTSKSKGAPNPLLAFAKKNSKKAR